MLGLSKKENLQELFWSLIIEPNWVQAGIWQTVGEKAKVVAISPPAAWEKEEELVGAADTALSSAVQKLSEEETEPSKTVFGVPSSWVEGGQIKKEYLDKIKQLCEKLSLAPVGFVVVAEAIAHYTKSEEGAPLNAIVVGIADEALEISVFKLGNLVGSTSVLRSVSMVEDILEGLARFSLPENLPSRFLLYDGKEGELGEAKDLLSEVVWEEHEKVRFLHTPKIEVFSPQQKVLAVCLAGAAEIAQATKVDNLQLPEIGVKLEELGFVMGKDVVEQEKPKPSTQVTPVAKPISKIRGRHFLGFILGFILISFLLWWFVPSAEVAVYVFPKTLKEETEILINKELPGKKITIQVSGEKTTATTGIKTVGEKAKGTVKVQNGTPLVINLTAGTILTAANDLRFSLDKTASVSAALSPANPGIANLEATAVGIGAEYNLAKDEVFKVDNYSRADVDALALSDFSGGTSRQISAVSQEDQDKIETQLKEELLANATSQLSGQIDTTSFLIDSSTKDKSLNSSFSAKVGDEASNLKLSLTLEVSAIAVTKTDLYILAKEIFKEKTPGGFEIKENNFDFVFAAKDEAEDEYTLSISANYLPLIDNRGLARQISGKSTTIVENQLSLVPGFSRAEIIIRPRLLGRIGGTLSHLSSRIKVEIFPEK